MTPPARKPPSFGDHEVVRLIAKGGMGSVFEVRSRTTGAVYAAKSIHRPDDAMARERFRREAELLARVDRHPGIVKIHALGESPDGGLYLILDLVRGESLDDLLEREDRLEPGRAATIARAIAAALGHAHTVGIVHRDVKPANVLLDAAGTPRLTDFGLATARDLERLTRTGAFLGTVSYCAPEQALGGATGPWSDVFSLGCVLYHCLAGAPPVAGERNVDILARLASAESLPDVRLAAPSVPAPLAAILARALEKEPEARYPNGDELERDLGRFLAGEPIVGGARRRRKRGLALLAIPAVALLAWAFVPGARTRAADAALAAARAEVELVRDTLARTRTPADADLAAASDHMARAVAQAALAESAGIADAGSRTIPAKLRADLAAALAAARLTHGEPRAALDLLDAVPGAPGSLEAPGRVVRARALLALGRAELAAGEAAAALASGADRVETGELLGDARASSGDPTGAEAAYGAALALAANRPVATPLRAKRGGAAALAGDHAVAFADLDVLLPDRHAIAAERADNERLAPIAPALYARGIAGTDGEAIDRDLEAAWRLAPPPPSLTKAVADAWVARARTEAAQWSTATAVGMSLEERDTDRLRAILGLVTRARTFDPSITLRSFGGLGMQLRSFYGSNFDPKRIEAFARKMLRDWPDEPIFLYLLARSRRGAHGLERREAMQALEHAVDCFPAKEGDEDRETRALAHDLGTIFLDAFFDEHGDTRVDLDRTRTIIARADDTDGWDRLAEAYLRLQDLDRAIEAFERAEATTSSERHEGAHKRAIEARATALILAGRVDDAIDLAHRLNPDPVEALRVLTTAALRANNAEVVVRQVNPDTVSDPVTLAHLARALVRLGRTDEARALQAKLAAGPNTAAAAEVGKAIEAVLLKLGK